VIRRVSAEGPWGVGVRWRQGNLVNDWIVANEPALRLGTFFGVFAVMAVWELVASRRELSQSRGKRWFANIGILVVGSLIVRVLFPTAAVGLALFAKSEGWGLLNRIELPPVLAFILSVVLLDLAIYLQHVMFHAVPALWRLHMVHHSDQDFDLTTGIRFHPLEIVLSIIIKFAVIVALGPPPEAVFIFAVLLNATSIFNHGNVRIPRGIDRWLRWIVVTPDMHRVHHSVEISESNSNFGFNLPWWDHFFGTYTAQPRAGHLGMKIGVEHLQKPEASGLVSLIGMPFTAPTGGYAIGERWSSRDEPEQPPPDVGS
jgi:sterol desaturase/sphingolipid hydroxylase (fatty acid hydroxylase superfamily)